MPTRHQAMALTVGLPLMMAAISWAVLGFVMARGAPALAVWAGFEFCLAWTLPGLASGHLVSGFVRRAGRVVLIALALVPVVHLIGWGLAGPIGAVVAPHLPAVPRQMVEMGGYYLGIAAMVAFAVEDLERAWQQREAEGGDRPA